MHHRFTLWTAAVVSLLAAASNARAQTTTPSDYLYAWTASADTSQPDFLAVFDARASSTSYGQLITTVPVPGHKNRPHHTEYQMPADGRLFANGFATGQTFIFDIRDATRSLAARPASPACKKVRRSNPWGAWCMGEALKGAQTAPNIRPGGGAGQSALSRARQKPIVAVPRNRR